MFAMLLTAAHLRTLKALAPSEGVMHPSARVSEDEDDLYRVLDVQGLVRPPTNQGYTLTDDGREALHLLQEMLAAGVLPEIAEAPAGWRFLGSEVLASLAAAERVGGQVGPVALDLLRARGFVDAPAAKRARGTTCLNRFGTTWLEWARRHHPRLEITTALAQSVRRMPVAYAEPHLLDIPASHRAQLEAMDLLAWSVPDGQSYTLSALGHAVHDALTEGGYPVADVVLNDELLSQLATLQERGKEAIAQEQLANVQALGSVDAQGQLTPAGQAALRARHLREAEPAHHPATFAIGHEEAELLGVMHRLSEGDESAKQQATTKGALHKALIERLDRRYQEMVGRYGRTINEVPARKREAETLLAELRERDRAFADPASLDDLLVHLGSFDLVRTEGSGHETVYRVTPLGHVLLQGQDQEQTPHDVTSAAVKAITLTTTTGRFQAPASEWVRQARAQGLIGSVGITSAGRLYARLATQGTRWPSLTREEARVILHLPEVEPPARDRRPGAEAEDEVEDKATDQGTDEEQLEHALDRLEARGLIDRLVDGHIVRTETGQLLTRAVSGALELARPVTPAIVRLLAAVRQVGTTLYVKEEKVRRPPSQWEEVERLTGLGPDDFKETVHLARLGQYLGDASLTEAGEDLLAVLAQGKSAATPS
jgi:hypothetical protein